MSRRLGRGAVRCGPCPPCGPPRTSLAGPARPPLFGEVRGSCLASRVSKVACWASFNDSTGVGGRPWTRWKSAASSPGGSEWRRGGPTSERSKRGRRRRFLGPAATVDRGWAVRRTGRRGLPGGGSPGGVVGFRRRHRGLEQDASVDGQPAPVRVCTLLATATWVCRSGRHGCPGG